MINTTDSGPSRPFKFRLSPEHIPAQLNDLDDVHALVVWECLVVHMKRNWIKHWTHWGTPESLARFCTLRGYRMSTNEVERCLDVLISLGVLAWPSRGEYWKREKWALIGIDPNAGQTADSPASEYFAPIPADVPVPERKSVPRCPSCGQTLDGNKP